VPVGSAVSTCLGLEVVGVGGGSCDWSAFGFYNSFMLALAVAESGCP